MGISKAKLIRCHFLSSAPDPHVIEFISTLLLACDPAHSLLQTLLFAQGVVSC